MNPAHLEAVTQRVNLLRGEGFAAKKAAQTHCLRGHPLTGANLRVRVRSVGRECKTCYSTYKVRRRESEAALSNTGKQEER